MSSLNRSSARELIQSNIDKFGHHIYLVAPSGAVPRFAYTIGLESRNGIELILAGASVYLAHEVERVINEVAKGLSRHADWSTFEVTVGALGKFCLRKVDPSWTQSLLLGAIDFYERDSIDALQIVSDDTHWTVDVPDLSKPWSASSEPVWQWLRSPWTFPVATRSTATTNLGALKGGRVTEAARWEEDQWELFAGAGPDVPKEDVRIVPLSTLLAIDASLVIVTKLDIGRALWRDEHGGQWHNWG
jgi:Domain of unknown function (DUF4262)